MTVVTAYAVSGWLTLGCALASEYGPWNLFGRVDSGMLVILISAWLAGPALAGALMIYEASVAEASSVPGGIGGWIARSAAATAVWFSVVLATASVSERANTFILVAAWWISMAAAVGVVVMLVMVILGLGS